MRQKSKKERKENLMLGPKGTMAPIQDFLFLWLVFISLEEVISSIYNHNLSWKNKMAQDLPFFKGLFYQLKTVVLNPTELPRMATIMLSSTSGIHNRGPLHGSQYKG